MGTGYGITKSWYRTSGGISFAVSSRNIVSSGLVLFLDSSFSASYRGYGNIWSDLSPQNNNSILYNSPAYVDNSYFAFNGIDGYVDTNKTASQYGIYDAAYTMHAIIRVPNLSGDKMAFGTLNGGTRQGMHHGVRNTALYFGHLGQDAFSPNSTVSANTWYFVTWMYSLTAPNQRIYLNGATLVGSSNLGSFIGTNTILIASAATVSRSLIDINCALIYNRELTSDEINQNYNALRGRFGI